MKCNTWLGILKVGWSAALISFFFVNAVARAESLSLNDYLGQVRKTNLGHQAAVEKREGAKARSGEADLLFAPALFANAGFRWDKKLPQLPFFMYNELDTHQFAIGVQKQTRFGLLAKLSYQTDFTNFIGATLPPTAAGPVPLTFWDTRPVLELSQPLWQNGFGSSLKATETMLNAQSQAETLGAEAERQQIELMAEGAYWRLAAAREVLKQNEFALNGSTSIFKYVSDKASSNLADRADVLQARAALETRRLDIKSARDEVRAASRNFNMLRNLPVEQEPEALEGIPWDKIASIDVPDKKGARADVKAAEALLRMQEANAVTLREKSKPQLDVFAQYALNGRNAKFSDSVGNSYQAGRPTVAAGLKFTMPLDIGTLSDSREGASRLERAAQLGLAQKQYEEKQQWTELTERLKEAKERFALAEVMEAAQKEKLEYERKRLKQGRTTTFQQLVIEQEYTLSGLLRVKAAAEALTTRAQMKLYEVAQ